jgi:hypothetical protein
MGMYVCCGRRYTARPARFKLRSKQDGGWVRDNSKWLSSSVNQAMRELDYDRFSQTAYARDRLARRYHDTGDDFGSHGGRAEEPRRWGAS